MYAYVHIIFDDSAFGWLISGSDCSLVTSSFVRVRGTCIRNSKYLVGPGRWGAFFLFFLLIPFGVMSANPSFRFSWLRPGTAWPCRMWWSGSNGATWLMSLGYAVASLWRMWRFYAGGQHNWMPRAICPWRPTLVAAICQTCLHKMCQERWKKQGVGGEGGQHGVEIAQKESGRRLDLRYLEVAWNWSCTGCTIPFSVVARSKESKSLRPKCLAIPCTIERFRWWFTAPRST